MQEVIEKMKELSKLSYKTKDGDMLDKALTSIPKSQTKLVSPRIGRSHGLKSFDRSKLWEYTCEINDVVQTVKNGKYPWDYLAKHYPKKWGKLSRTIPEPLKSLGIKQDDPVTLAMSVMMDDPIDFGLAIRRYLDMEGVKMKDMQTYKHIGFLEGVPHVIENLSDRIKRALEKMFEEKYLHVIPRPEQVWEHITGLDRLAFGIYEAPNHPAYGAGHSAVFGATLKFFMDEYILTGKQLQAVREATFLGAFGRNMAGVHYSVDSLAGFELAGLI